MQIKSFEELAAALRIPIPKAKHKLSLPPPETPPPEKNKVMGEPTRVPVNKQAALMVSPIRCWLSKPLPPEKLPNPHREEIDALKAELKTERNKHALTRDALGVARDAVRQMHDTFEKQDETIFELRQKIKAQEFVIKQLEDLKL